MVGIPDGLGAMRHGHEITLLMNGEITAQRPGIGRAHGEHGAFVSRWTIDRRPLEVLALQDHTPSPPTCTSGIPRSSPRHPGRGVVRPHRRG